jgi:hypothetical protein
MFPIAEGALLRARMTWAALTPVAFLGFGVH